MAENLSDPINETDATGGGSLLTLRKTSMIACLVGAGGSISLFLLASQQAPILIILLFVCWLLAPFAVLFVAHASSKRWSESTQTTLYYVTLLVTVASLTIYGYQVLWPRQSTPAFYWVAIPPVSGLVIVTALAVATLISRRKTRQEPQSLM